MSYITGNWNIWAISLSTGFKAVTSLSSNKTSPLVGFNKPEIIFNNGEDYDLKIDIYSLALNFWFICSGKVPYAELDTNPHVIQLIQLDYRPNIGDIEIIELQDLIKQMWSTNPDNRPDIDHLLKMIEEIKIVEKQNKCCIC